MKYLTIILAVSLSLGTNFAGSNAYAAKKTKAAKAAQATSEAAGAAAGAAHEATPSMNHSSSSGEVPFVKWLVGSIVGTAGGLGIGHAIQGSYMEKGWKFSVIDGCAIGAIIAGSVMSVTGSSAGGIVSLSGFGLLVGSHGWQAYELWTTPHADASKRAEKPGTVTPFFAATPKGGLLALSLKF